MNAPLHDVLREMNFRGGRFVRRLAHLCEAADPENLKRLIEAFPEIFERYAALASIKAPTKPKTDL